MVAGGSAEGRVEMAALGVMVVEKRSTLRTLDTAQRSISRPSFHCACCTSSCKARLAAAVLVVDLVAWMEAVAWMAVALPVVVTEVQELLEQSMLDRWSRPQMRRTLRSSYWCALRTRTGRAVVEASRVVKAEQAEWEVQEEALQVLVVAHQVAVRRELVARLVAARAAATANTRCNLRNFGR